MGPGSAMFQIESSVNEVEGNLPARRSQGNAKSTPSIVKRILFSQHEMPGYHSLGMLP